MIDLPAYLARIGCAGDLQADARALAALHLAHATSIPFENLDVLAGRPIRLEPDAIQAKLVGERRGGYCFEQNRLFAAVLEQLGFRVRSLAARVRYRTQRILPRTHMLLLVETPEGEWVADVGFGGEGLLLPVPFGRGEVSRQFAWSYRVVAEGPLHVMQSGRGGAWQDLYAFGLEPQETADFEMANHYVSTHPESRFVRTLTVQLPTPTARWTLRNRELVQDTGARADSRLLADDAEVRAVLAGLFQLPWPADLRLPA
ncbi:MAG: arylamine N-acetyltransferase [Rhodocyclaceae bacterium]|nr:arylamine N-acetyltransferase [Rhodocyclaceae bacterium]